MRTAPVNQSVRRTGAQVAPTCPRLEEPLDARVQSISQLEQPYQNRSFKFDVRVLLGHLGPFKSALEPFVSSKLMKRGHRSGIRHTEDS